jgi:tetratricopeptide (TPR) repeat protein
LIVDTSLEYLRRLTVDVRGDPGLALAVANAYMRVAEVQGVSIGANLGQLDQAEKNIRIAEGFIDSVLISQPANRAVLILSAQIVVDRMLLARFNGRHDEALSLARKAVDSLERFHAVTSDQSEASWMVGAYLNVAQQYLIEQQYDEALRLSVRGADIARSLNRQSDLGAFLVNSAEVFRSQGDLDEALKQIHKSVTLLEPDRSRTMSLIRALTREGWILGVYDTVSMGRPKEAVSRLLRAFKIADDFVHRDRDDQYYRGYLAVAGLALAPTLSHLDPRNALDIYDHTLRHLAEVRNNNSSFKRYEVYGLAGSSYPLRRLGRPA